MEDRFFEREHWGVRTALAECCALLVDGEVHDWCEVGDDVEAVLEADFHVVFCGFFLHPAHVVDGVGVAEVQAVVVLLEDVSIS